MVKEKYFLSDDVVEKLICKAENSEYKNPQARYRPQIGDGSYALRSQEFVRTGFSNECLTLSARDYKDPKCVCVGMLDIPGQENIRRVYDTEGIGPCLTTMEGGNRQPKVLIKENTKQGYVEAYEGDGIRLDHIGGTTGRARVQPQRSNTLTTGDHAGVIDKGFKIRKLTPKECWRLQGVKDEITNRVMAAGISDTQMYRGAGDACTVNVIYEIAKRL
jgi:DNA (cytosine-5)-methyltransferase 1